MVIAKMSPEELSAVAGKLKGKTDVAEVKNILQAEVKRLVVAGQLIAAEIGSLC